MGIWSNLTKYLSPTLTYNLAPALRSYVLHYLGGICKRKDYNNKVKKITKKPCLKVSETQILYTNVIIRFHFKVILKT